MLGTGRLVKTLGYAAWTRLARSPESRFIAALAPNYREYRRLLHHSNDIIVSAVRRYVYVANLKAASTSVRNRLWELEGHPPLDDPTDIWEQEGGLTFARQLGRRELYAAFHEPDWYRFSFVRNPFERLVSSYRFLVARIEPPVHGRRRFRPRALRSHPAFAPDMDFATFVRIACVDEGYWRDAHLHRQVDLLRIPAVRYDFIGKVERFRDDMVHVLERLDAPAEVIARAGDVSNPSAGDKAVAAWFTPALADMVRERYAEDFRRFDYPLDVPD